MQVKQKNMSKIIENYLLKEVVGQGQYGKVYRAIHQKTNQVFAVKVIKIDKFKSVPKLQQFTINEIETLNTVKNENVVGFVEMLRTQNNVYLVYQFCNGGTLEDQIKKQGYLKEDYALVILKQIIFAFKQLFKANILHRDLKPTNILFDNGILKIADFGFCKSLNGPQDMTQTMVGSPIYMAPEILKGEPYNLKADIWSIGVCFFECLFGYCPYEDRTIAKLIMQINTKQLQIPLHKQNISVMSQELLKAMLVTDPDRRISWEQLLSHPLFANYTGMNQGQNQNQSQNRSVSPLQTNNIVNQQRKNNSPPIVKKEVIRTVDEAIKVPNDSLQQKMRSYNRSISPNKPYKQQSQHNAYNNITTTSPNTYSKQNSISPEKKINNYGGSSQNNNSNNQNQQLIKNIVQSLKDLNVKRQKVIQNLTFIKWFLQERFSQQHLSENMNRFNINNDNMKEMNDSDKPYLNEVFVFLVIKYSTIRIQHFLKISKDLQKQLQEFGQNRTNNLQNDQQQQQQFYQQETNMYEQVLDKEYNLFSSLYRQYKTELSYFLKQNNIMNGRGKFNIYNQVIQEIIRETENEMDQDQKINEQFLKNYINCVILREIQNPGNIPFSHLNSFLESILYEDVDQKQILNYCKQIHSQNTDTNPMKNNDMKLILEYKLKLVSTKNLSVSL